MEVFEPNPKSVRSGFYKKINGIWHKRCTGPSHADEPDGIGFLPATPKYFYIRGDNGHYGKLANRCRLCQTYGTIQVHGTSGLIEAHKVRHFYDEAVNRIGMAELARRTNLSRDGISNVLTGKAYRVRKANLRKIVLELTSIRRNRENSAGYHSKMHAIKRINKDGTCNECGTSIANYTDGCRTCINRKYDREVRVR
jgi:hypothetical protein